MYLNLKWGRIFFLGKEWQNRFRICSLKLDNRQWLQKIDIEIGNKLKLRKTHSLFGHYDLATLYFIE